MAEELRPLSVYIHIPFCVKKCFYCDFLSSPAPIEEQQAYIKALLREIETESRSYVNYTVRTIFIGGGTPSILPGEDICRILDVLRKNYRISTDCEISMEVNPGTVTSEKACLWKKAGINRISIGLQSANDKELHALGRIHNSRQFFETYEEIVKTGFNNINIDLMSAIPYQTLDSYRQTLQQVTGLVPPPVHISAYSLIIEEGTPFYDTVSELPDEDCEREMYKITDEFLCEHGYHRYEISNYAKPGYECRHNQVYWQRGDYVGFGIGSASLINNVRFHNCNDILRYVNYYVDSRRDIFQKQDTGKPQNSFTACTEAFNGKGVKEEVQLLSREEQMEEFMFLGLRMMQGVSNDDFFRNFGQTIGQVYPGIVEKFCEQGLLGRKEVHGEEWIFLTKYGIDVSNRVMAEFLLT